MTPAGTTGRNLTAATTLLLTACVLAVGCESSTFVSSGAGNAGSDVRSDVGASAEPVDPRDSDTAVPSDSGASIPSADTLPAAEKPIDVPIAADNGTPSPSAAGAAPVEPAIPVEVRTFRPEGPEDALRISFDDLDLLKILKMDPVTNDCVGKMPSWLRDLNGKTVRIRGFMKPGLVITGIPQFMLVRDTGLCCFGPKGKIYDMIATTLKPPTTTDYIELRPFDVVGRFRIELLEEDGIIFGLYYLDDAKIIQR
jgi:hypothetical protein